MTTIPLGPTLVPPLVEGARHVLVEGTRDGDDYIVVVVSSAWTSSVRFTATGPTSRVELYVYLQPGDEVQAGNYFAPMGGMGLERSHPIEVHPAIAPVMDGPNAIPAPALAPWYDPDAGALLVYGAYPGAQVHVWAQWPTKAGRVGSGIASSTGRCAVQFDTPGTLSNANLVYATQQLGVDSGPSALEPERIPAVAFGYLRTTGVHAGQRGVRVLGCVPGSLIQFTSGYGATKIEAEVWAGEDTVDLELEAPLVDGDSYNVRQEFRPLLQPAREGPLLFGAVASATEAAPPVFLVPPVAGADTLHLSGLLPGPDLLVTIERPLDHLRRIHQADAGYRDVSRLVGDHRLAVEQHSAGCPPEDRDGGPADRQDTHRSSPFEEVWHEERRACRWRGPDRRRDGLKRTGRPRDRHRHLVPVLKRQRQLNQRLERRWPRTVVDRQRRIELQAWQLGHREIGTRPIITAYIEGAAHSHFNTEWQAWMDRYSAADLNRAAAEKLPGVADPDLVRNATRDIVTAFVLGLGAGDSRWRAWIDGPNRPDGVKGLPTHLRILSAVGPAPYPRQFIGLPIVWWRGGAPIVIDNFRTPDQWMFPYAGPYDPPPGGPAPPEYRSTVALGYPGALEARNTLMKNKGLLTKLTPPWLGTLSTHVFLGGLQNGLVLPPASDCVYRSRLHPAPVGVIPHQMDFVSPTDRLTMSATAFSLVLTPNVQLHTGDFLVRLEDAAGNIGAVRLATAHVIPALKPVADERGSAPDADVNVAVPVATFKLPLDAFVASAGTLDVATLVYLEITQSSAPNQRFWFADQEVDSP